MRSSILISRSRTMETIRLLGLAWALLNLIGSREIYYVFKIKARSPFSILFLSQTRVNNIFSKIWSKHASRIKHFCCNLVESIKM